MNPISSRGCHEAECSDLVLRDYGYVARPEKLLVTPSFEVQPSTSSTFTNLPKSLRQDGSVRMNILTASSFLTRA